MIVYRTVKNGRVKIKNKYFYPPEPYDGRFENIRFAFGTYMNYDALEIHDYCSLWGTEQEAKTFVHDEHPIYAKDGYLVWNWWRVK